MCLTKRGLNGDMNLRGYKIYTAVKFCYLYNSSFILCPEFSFYVKILFLPIRRSFI